MGDRLAQRAGTAAMSPEEVAAVAGKLTKAQRRAVAEGEHGYCDDSSLYGSERAMLYRLETLGLFCRPIGDWAGRRPDLELTQFGLLVRDYLRRQQP